MATETISEASTSDDAIRGIDDVMRGMEPALPRLPVMISGTMPATWGQYATPTATIMTNYTRYLAEVMAEWQRATSTLHDTLTRYNLARLSDTVGEDEQLYLRTPRSIRNLHADLKSRKGAPAPIQIPEMGD
jgi:hypothetical protein